MISSLRFTLSFTLSFTLPFTILLATLILPGGETSAMSEPVYTLENDWLRLSVGADARPVAFVDKTRDVDYLDTTVDRAFATVMIEGQQVAASAARRDGEALVLTFGDGEATARLQGSAHPRYLRWEVLDATGTIDSLIFADISTTLPWGPDSPFVATALTLNLHTQVHHLPMPVPRVAAQCTRKFGLTGAAVAVIGCPPGELRGVLQEIVQAEDGVPESPLGGPFALDAPDVYASYLMDTRARVTTETADQWIRMAQDLGVRQIDMHAGNYLRFGDYRPNPGIYPNGEADLKAAIDQLRAAGIEAGLHTYSHFAGINSAYIQPVPHPGLKYGAIFTLAEDLPADATRVPVRESTVNMSTHMGFSHRNSITLRIGDELLEYHGIDKEEPFGFTGCVRGAHGTRVADHPKGATVAHLKQLFGLFVPDPDGELFTEIIDRTAEVYNHCGFGMIYLDALDGADMLSDAGREDAWYYSALFAWELNERLNRPAIYEMSMFNHHLWFVRSRVGAWDMPFRGYKPFVDAHSLANESASWYFMPAHLGWWGVFHWDGFRRERTFPDDIEYLMGKAVAQNSSLSWIAGFDIDTYFDSTNARRLAALIRRYEDLRLGNKVPADIRARLAEPMAEFTLEGEGDDWRFREAAYHGHRVDGLPGRTSWTVNNTHNTQPLQFRIEGMLSAEPFDATATEVITDFGDPGEFIVEDAAEGVSLSLKAGEDGARLVARNNGAPLHASWASVALQYDPARALPDRTGLGIWIDGDGSGTLLNFQLQSPRHVDAGAWMDRFVAVDWTGRRYVELVEPEAERVADYTWPYVRRRSEWADNRAGMFPSAIGCYRRQMEFEEVEFFRVYVNNVPEGRDVNIDLGPIKTLPLVENELQDLVLTVNGQPVRIPGELKSGEYLECREAGVAQVYDAQGEPVRVVELPPLPDLVTGNNEIQLSCQSPGGATPRARVTLITLGNPL